ncbi:hypothetical protein RBH29_04235 [Herbivorax sp. ANBcel31]|uniref:hypothetical protein n=1 Tax=Herbivorax sp. ANBcel31 TaxID=3069754 RepID=UPI0027B59C75|nr:hypothetical protein [Herbivorax sp. ANBcel31]MDQ2085642.1 hypothetical protein [Herbivorax sp. ANBcel31]
MSDIYGNKGEYSHEIEVSTLEDTNPPVITSVEPEAGRYANNIRLLGRATDDVGVKTFVFQISQDKINWSDIQNIDLTDEPKNARASYNFDISSYDDGIYYIRSKAYDAAGNVSSIKPYVEYYIDHTPPNTPTGVRVTNAQGNITIEWDQGEEIEIFLKSVD